MTRRTALDLIRQLDLDATLRAAGRLTDIDVRTTLDLAELARQEDRREGRHA